MSDPAARGAREARDAAPGEERLRERCLANALWAKFYEGWELIGRGAYGTVIRTRHRTLGDIAVKAFEWLSPEEESRFDQEAAILARLLHPSIVRIYGVFKDDGLYWFEMERVQGPTLKEALERRQAEGVPVCLPEALAMAINVAEALQAAHVAGVVHRDVKPANVLLPVPQAGHGPRAKLGDFGVSRVFDAARHTATGMVVGSYEYAAPELFAGRTATTASDVYSFMVLLYRLLTDNSYPYELNGERSPMAFMEAHTKQVALPVGLLNHELSQELQDLVTLGLSKDPRRRPSWDEILGALKESEGSRPVASHRVSLPERRPRHAGAFVRRLRSGAVAPGYVLGVSVVALAVASFVIARGTPEEISPAQATAHGDSRRGVPSVEPSSAPMAEAPAHHVATRAVAPTAHESKGAANPAVESRAAGVHDVSSSERGVLVELAGEALRVRNVTNQPMSVRVEAITRTGSRHAVTVSRLDPGLQHTVFLDAMTPPVPGEAGIASVEVVDLGIPGKAPIRLDVKQ